MSNNKIIKLILNITFLILLNILSSTQLRVKLLTSLSSQLSTNFIPYIEANYALYKEKAIIVSEEIRDALKDEVKNINKDHKNAWCIIAPIKDLNRLNAKIETQPKRFKNKNGEVDFENVTDLARSTFLVENLDEVYKVKDDLIRHFGEPTVLKDNYKNNKSGYRDLNVIFHSKKVFLERDLSRDDNNGLSPKYGLKFEVQINTCNMFLAKEIAHKIYEQVRVIKPIYFGTSTIRFHESLKIANMSEEDYNKDTERVLEFAKFINMQQYIHILNGKIKEMMLVWLKILLKN